MSEVKPLWLQMADAFLGPSGPNTLATFAPEAAEALRSIANTVAPKEPKPEPGSGMMPGGTRMYYHEKLGRWEERMLLRRKLLDAANEAEAFCVSSGNRHLLRGQLGLY